MIKLENFEATGFEHAIRGMRNPMNSWEKSDTKWETRFSNDRKMITDEKFMSDSKLIIGTNDHELMTKLAKGGSVHAKYRRMITVYIDITAPLYWWKEFDTYKVGTVANSCSTMHKIHEKEFTMEDFSYEHLDYETRQLFKDGNLVCDDGTYCTYNCSAYDFLCITCDVLNKYRDLYLETNDKKYWWQMIQLLPSSYNQKRTVMLNYEVLSNIYRWRKDHKLDEWREFCEWIKTLPYSEIITGPVIGVDLANGSDFTVEYAKTNEEAIKEIFDAIEKNLPRDGYLPL